MALRLLSSTLWLLVLALLMSAGCHSREDQRDAGLHAANQAALQAQKQQNQLVAAQSQALAENSRQITAAAEAVLAREHEIREQLNQQQAQVDNGRNELEKERQVLALQRHRDPLIAAAVQSVGLWFACTTPLLIGVYVLRLMLVQQPEHAALADLLVSELVSDQPKLLPAAAFGPPRLGHRGTSPELLPDDAPPDDAPF
jgi:hypothetical protein